MLNVVVLNDIMPLPNAFKLNVIMLNVVMLKVIVQLA